MNCKNCGAKLRENARVCPNCGAFVDDKSGYTLLTSDDRYDDYYPEDELPSKRRKKKGSSALSFILALILTAAIIGGGAYYYFTHFKTEEKVVPTVTISSGCGVINGGEKVLYFTIAKNSNIQYIHGATLYSAENSKDKKLLTADYEYTKNIDGTFRCIYFEADNPDLKGAKKVVAEIKLSFLGDDEIYTYTCEGELKSKFKKDASDFVFDHSNSKLSAEEQPSEEETETEPETEKKTEPKKADASFVYESYWFTEPVTDGDTKTIFALKFNENKSFVSTRYVKEGNKSWAVTTVKGKFEIDGDLIKVNVDGEAEDGIYRIGDNEITEEFDSETVQTLTARKYNSVKNVEDFFGM